MMRMMMMIWLAFLLLLILVFASSSGGANDVVGLSSSSEMKKKDTVAATDGGSDGSAAYHQRNNNNSSNMNKGTRLLRATTTTIPLQQGTEGGGASPPSLDIMVNTPVIKGNEQQLQKEIDDLFQQQQQQQQQQVMQLLLQQQHQQQQQQEIIMSSASTTTPTAEATTISSTNIDFDPITGGYAHIRMKQYYEDMEIEGAALVVHVHPNGTLTSMNGEFVTTVATTATTTTTTTSTVAAAAAPAAMNDNEKEEVAAEEEDARTLLDLALEETGIMDIAFEGEWEWIGEPQKAMVLLQQRREGEGGGDQQEQQQQEEGTSTACWAWKQLIRYNINKGSKGDGPQLDWIYADATYSFKEADAETTTTSNTRSDENTSNDVPVILEHLFQNDTDATRRKKSQQQQQPQQQQHRQRRSVLCARHPQYMGLGGGGIPNLKTYDCNGRTSFCSLESTSSSPINTGDVAVDAAHNYAIATYNYFYQTFGRDSLDDQGMTLISYVHYDRNYNNAFWDGQSMTYGDGDGITIGNLALGVDVVAHELTHGITSSTSNLIYRYESGAINEAMSDIFGAMVDRQEGATGNDIWLVGEDIYTPNQPGDAIRDMANPTKTNDGRDYYPERYVGSSDNGGVHINSGIVNLAFYLLVMGGRHPRGKTPSVVVEGIGFEAAASIFYWANVDCLTPSATFQMARFCTAEIFGGEHRRNVHQAWDAVGVPGSPPTTSNPTDAPSPVPTTSDTTPTAKCCSDFENDGENACNAARIGNGFTSYKCKWCRSWFGFGDEACTADFNVFCR